MGVKHKRLTTRWEWNISSTHFLRKTVSITARIDRSLRCRRCPYSAFVCLLTRWFGFPYSIYICQHKKGSLAAVLRAVYALSLIYASDRGLCPISDLRLWPRSMPYLWSTPLTAVYALSWSTPLTAVYALSLTYASDSGLRPISDLRFWQRSTPYLWPTLLTAVCHGISCWRIAFTCFETSDQLRSGAIYV